MQTKMMRERLLASTIIAGAMLFASAASAQSMPAEGATPAAPTVGGSDTSSLPKTTDTVDASGSNASETGTIVVTGSRIANPNLTSASPLTVVNAAEVRLQGTTRVEDLINNLPQAFADQGGNLSNGSSGTANINLRDLGAVRTLVLVNGKRLLPGDPIDPAADVNFVPAALIQNVQVLTGGASSVYGSDAVAGVVNFIMDKDFTGVRLDAQYSFFNHENGDDTIQSIYNARFGGAPKGNTTLGDTKDVTLVVGAGTDDNRGHITAYASWRRIAAVTQDQYDYSACSLAESGSSFACSGSGTTSPARFITNGGAGSQLTLNPAVASGAFRPYVGSRDAFNFAPYNYYQRPDERYSLGAFAHYEINEHFDPYLEVMFMDDRTRAQIAPSGIFGQIFSIGCNSPLLSAAQQTQLCGAGAGTAATTSLSIGKRNVEGGGRVNDLRHTDYRIVGGVKGQINDAFSYDVYGQMGRAILSENYQNDFSVARTRQALNVVSVGGVLQCADANARAAGCVPYNIFQPGGVTQAALNYLQTPGFESGQTTEYVADASITGDLGNYGIQSPWSDNGVGIAIGTEYRKETLEFRTDAEFTTGDLAGQGGPTIGFPGVPGFHVKEGFGEISVPLASDKPFFNELTVTGGYRYSSYSTAGSTNTYKGDVRWSPIPAFTLRGSYNHAVRAPNVNELFSPQSQGLFAGTDPCAGAATVVNGVARVGVTATNPGVTLAQCARSGVTAAQFGNIVSNSANQYTQFSGGNTSLKPETSNTYTGGILIAPKEGFARGFSLSVDYFHIKVKDLIGTVGANLILAQCVNAGNLCQFVQRDPTNGSLFLGTVGQVVNQTTNIGSLTTSGVDVASSYRLDLADFGLNNVGKVGFDFTGTYTRKFTTVPGVVDVASGTTSYECAGRYGLTCGTPIPKWRHKLRVTLTTPNDIQFSVNWRFIEHVTTDQASANPFLAGNVFPVDQRLGNRNYFDLAASVRLVDKFSLRVGVNNVFDKDPPLVGSSSLPGTFGNGNTFPQVYDSLGRYMYAGVTLDF